MTGEVEILGANRSSSGGLGACHQELVIMATRRITKVRVESPSEVREAGDLKIQEAWNGVLSVLTFAQTIPQLKAVRRQS